MPRQLSDLLQEKFGTKATPFVNRLGVSTIGTAFSKIYAVDPNRLGLIFVNLSANTLTAHFDNTVTLTKGIVCGPNGGGYALVWEEDFELTSSEWFAIASAAASPILAYEIVSAGA